MSCISRLINNRVENIDMEFIEVLNSIYSVYSYIFVMFTIMKLMTHGLRIFNSVFAMQKSYADVS